MNTSETRAAAGARGGALGGAPSQDLPRRPAERRPLPTWRSVGSLAVLLLLADWLFWHWMPGISLALFGVLLGAALLFCLDPAPRRRSSLVAAGIVILAVLPVVEHVQALSLAFLFFGLIDAALWSIEGAKSAAERVIGFIVHSITSGPVAVFDTVNFATLPKGSSHMIAGLILPVGLLSLIHI